MIPLITCEISFAENVCELVFGVDVFDLDFGIHINSIKQPIKCNYVSPGNMSHCRTPSFNDHLDHCFIVFKHIQWSFLTRRLDIWGNRINVFHYIDLLFEIYDACEHHYQVALIDLKYEKTFPRTETIRSHNSRANKPSNLNPVSKEMISDSVELWETAVCFLHIQLFGTNVWLPNMHNVPPEVDFESSRSPAKSESWNSPSLPCLAVFPTWQYCLYSLV